MKPFAWSEEKNRQLQVERGVSFEEVIAAIASGTVLDIVEHPNQDRYPNQRIFIVQLRAYAWLIPFVESDDEIFLKTIIPSRKATKQYLGGKDDEG
ncbi:MAG: BrnT family toxin [Chloroflexota bacterium]